MAAASSPVLVALISIIPTTITAVSAVVVLRVKKDTRQINNAVNHVKPDEDNLIDMVRQIRRDMAVIQTAFVDHLENHERQPERTNP